MPKFKITHVKQVFHYAEVIVEAKDIEEAENGNMGLNIGLSKWFDLNWYDEDGDPLWDLMEVEEIRDRDKEAEQEYWDLHPEEELKHKMNLKSYFNAKGGD